MPLDRTIQELEARLPDLRHLLAEGEVVLATSEPAALLADELEFLLGRADTVARRLRQLLLGGDLSGVMAQEQATPAEPIAVPATPTEATSEVTPADDSPSPEAWSDMDEDLARALGLLPEKEPSPEQKQKASIARAGKMLEPEAAENAPPQVEPLDTMPADERQAYIDELERLARQVIEDQTQIKELWRELGLDRPEGLDRPPDLPGGAAVGARLDPPPTPRSPGAGRTFEAAQEPPRNP